MNTEPTLTPDVEKALRRYLEIQKQERELREEKKVLQESLGNHLKQADATRWLPCIDGETLRVTRTLVTEITYDEQLLGERLGERYARILTPDSKKLKEHMDQATQLLQPILPQVGTPDRTRVQLAIEQGVIDKSEFAGAFTKTEKVRVAVGKPRAGTY